MHGDGTQGAAAGGHRPAQAAAQAQRARGSPRRGAAARRLHAGPPARGRPQRHEHRSDRGRMGAGGRSVRASRRARCAGQAPAQARGRCVLLRRSHGLLRQQWRDRVGRNPEPTAAIIDAQSTRSTAQGGMTGFDAGKKVKGRKRHLVVDTLGLLLAVTITAASVQDRDAAGPVVAQARTKVPGLLKMYADGAYGGRCARTLETEHPGLSGEIVRHPANRSTGTWHDAQQPLWPEGVPSGFVVQAKRWVVERTHAWNERARRLIAHHDRSSWAPIAWVWLVEARILATRARSQSSQPDESASEMNERQEGRGEFVVSRGDASELLDAVEETLDQIAILVEVPIELAGVEAIGAWGNDGLSVLGHDLRDEGIRIVGLVGDDVGSRLILDQCCRLLDIGRLPGRENHAQRIAQRIDRDMQLGRQSAPRAADVLAAGFFWAPAEC